MTTENSHNLPAGQMESIKFGNLLINFTSEFHRIWDSRGSGSSVGSFWRPTPAPDLLPGYFPLGDLAVAGYDNVNANRIVAVVCEGEPQGEDATRSKALSPPTDYEKVWRDANSGAAADCTVWRPIPPVGYVAMGLVCSNGRDKPLLNTIRCVREDLVIATSVSDLIWSDKGSGARQNFSAWNIAPPQAAPGEIHFSAGTFFGVQSHSRPQTSVAYALRMQIPRQSMPAPEAPKLSGYGAPPELEPAKVTETVRIPWFAVSDHLHPGEQLRTSPFYRLERSDQYVLVGHGHNTSDLPRPFRWKAVRAQSSQMQQIFSRLTSIEVTTPWSERSSSATRPIRFSAQLYKDFTYSEASVSGWDDSRPTDIVAMAAKNKAVAVYQIQSLYTLKRADGTQVAVSIGYTDDESLYLTEYPPEVDSALTFTPQLATEPSPGESPSVSESDDPPSAGQPITDDTIVTNTGP
ncbi:Vps62-related protein [Pseudomonas koreensis]|uniref:Vps62-related protein n=1 Tax=Pseudomonas koreensis TaxID=198620 RepID=UPI0021C893C7|nr:Vps62-related protein [Pseudomonas koreensis]MCU0073335.1 Vps62-related protein [Pseudomonas koreensis]